MFYLFSGWKEGRQKGQSCQKGQKIISGEPNLEMFCLNYLVLHNKHVHNSIFLFCKCKEDGIQASHQTIIWYNATCLFLVVQLPDILRQRNVRSSMYKVKDFLQNTFVV